MSNAVDTMPNMGSSTTSGGWQSLDELYAQGLITADKTTRSPVPRLAAAVPTLDDGTLQVLPDGRMKATYALRHDVKWQDGEPFTADDMTFSYEVDSDHSLPRLNVDAISQMDSVEAPDPYTFVIYFKAPYYLADSIGLRALWPEPRHLLEDSYRTLDPQAFSNLPFWSSSDYVHLGPFRLVDFKVGEELTFEAFDQYFLGRPKLDRVIVRVYNDENVLYAALKSGAVGMIMDNSLDADLGLQLKDDWDRSGEGTVKVGTGTTRFLSGQFDPSILQQPALLDPRVRKALAYGLDREAMSAAIQHGHGELVANSLLPPGDRLYDAVKDQWAVYTADPKKAAELFSEAGWTMGPDGTLKNSSGDTFTTSVWTTQGGDQEIAIIADAWKNLGVVADQSVVPGTRVRDREFRQSYPGYETSARGSGDAILSRIDPAQSTTAPSYAGSNRGHYTNPQMGTLIDQYRQTIDTNARGAVAHNISSMMVDDLPLLLLWFNPTTPAVRKGIKAFDDFDGGAEAARLYGTFSRDAHEWDITSQ